MALVELLGRGTRVERAVTLLLGDVQQVGGRANASGAAVKVEKSAPAGTQWTCPMHPEIVRDEPGACPICGMALEPMIPSDEPSHELTDFTRRL